MVFSSEMVFSFSSERFIPFPASALAVALTWLRSRRALINRLRARRVGAALRMLCDGFGTSDVQRGWIATSSELCHRQFRLSRPFARMEPLAQRGESSMAPAKHARGA